MSAGHSPDLVIFDCDGVLVDSEPLANALLAEAVGELGLSMSVEEVVDTYVGLSMASVMTDLEWRTGKPVPPGWLDALQARTFDAFRRELLPVRGVAAAIAALRAAGLSVCVASSGSHDKMGVSLGVTGLAPLFQGAIFSASSVPRGKPHPDLFLYAAAQMGIPPERAAVVEDSVPGVTAARAAGMRALGYAERTAPGRLAAAGAIVFTDMEALPGLLDVATPV